MEPSRPHWPNTFQRYHLTRGIRVVDNDTIVVSARDMVQRTQHGLIRTSSGYATYSQTHRQKAEIEVGELAQILASSDTTMWTPKKLETVFKERYGRPGIWAHYDLGIRAFLSCWSKTFELYGKDGEFVKLRRARNAVVLDHPEEVMTRLARARSDGILRREPSPDVSQRQSRSPELVPGGKTKVTYQPLSLPSLKTNRLKMSFQPYDAPFATDYMSFAGAYGQ